MSKPKIKKVTVTVLSPQQLSPNDIANIITNASNLAQNASQIPADEIELQIMGALDSSVSTQISIDEATAGLKEASASLKTTVDKEA